ncbi:hypothetical protein Mpsy_0614 [Methanolobus psychrophilus R15]|nr:hypothetical protein Mpsy_0614 [Methanolobus psychrophilus R15]
MSLFYLPTSILLIIVSIFVAYESWLMHMKGTPQSNHENGYLYAAFTTYFSMIAVCTLALLLISSIWK